MGKISLSFLSLLVFLCLAPILICYQPTELIFGQSCPLLGANQNLGIEMSHGIEASFREFNEQGGLLNNITVKLISFDDNYETEKAKVNTQNFLSRGDIFGLLGYVGTANAIAAMAMLANYQKLPFLAPVTGGVVGGVRIPFDPRFIHARGSYWDETAAMVNYITNFRLRHRVAIFYQNDAFGAEVLRGLDLCLTAVKLSLVAKASFEKGTYAGLDQGLERIAAAKPNAIVIAGTYEPAAIFIQQVKNRTDLFDAKEELMFLTVSFVGASGLTNALLQRKVSVGDGQLLMTQVFPSPFDRSIRLTREYQDAMKVAFPTDNFSFQSLEGYFAGRSVVHMLRLTKFPSQTITNTTEYTELLQDSFVKGFYKKGEYFIGDVRCGPYSYCDLTKISNPNCTENCNQGTTENDQIQYKMVSDGTFSWEKCISDGKNIIPALIFGQSAPLSGDFGYLGTRYSAGIRTAFLEYNEKAAKVKDAQKLALLSVDDGLNPDTTRENTRKILMDNGIFGLVGYISTDSSLAAIDEINRNITIKAKYNNVPIPFIGAYTGERTLRFPFQNNIINIRPSYNEEAHAMIEYVVKKKGFVQYAILYQDSTFCRAYLSAFRESLSPLNINSLSEYMFLGSGADLELAYKYIGGTQPKPQYIALCGSAVKSLANFIKFVKEDKKKFYDAPSEIVFSVISIFSAPYFIQQLESAGTNDQNVIITSVVPNPYESDAIISATFLKHYLEDYPLVVPDTIAFEGYIVGKFITESLSQMSDNGMQLTPYLFENFVYQAKSFALDGLQLGPFAWQIGTSQNITDSKSCNQGLREIHILNRKDSIISTAYTFSYSGTCLADTSKLLIPLLFGFSGTPMSAAFSKETNFSSSADNLESYSFGTALSFEESADGLNGYSLFFHKKPANSEAEVATITTDLSTRYKTVGLIGMQPSADTYNYISSSTRSEQEWIPPLIGSMSSSMQIRKYPFNERFVNLEGSIADLSAAIGLFFCRDTTVRSNMAVIVDQDNSDFYSHGYDALKEAVGRNGGNFANTFKYSSSSGSWVKDFWIWFVRLFQQTSNTFSYTDLANVRVLIVLAQIRDSRISEVLKTAMMMYPTLKVGVVELDFGLGSFIRANPTIASRIFFPAAASANTRMYTLFKSEVEEYASSMTSKMKTEFFSNFDFYLGFRGFIAGQFVKKVVQSFTTTSNSLNPEKFLKHIYTTESFEVDGQLYGPFSLSSKTASLYGMTPKTNLDCNQGAHYIYVSRISSSLQDITTDPEFFLQFQTCGVYFSPADYTAYLILIASICFLTCFVMQTCVCCCVIIVLLARRRVKWYYGAPRSGKLAIVSVSIQNSNKIWKKKPKIMKRAMAIYSEVLRQLLMEFGGYEIKSQGDTFLCAFKYPLDAIDWAMALQKQTLEPNIILNKKNVDVKYKSKISNCLQKCCRVCSSYFSLKKNFDWPRALFSLKDARCEIDKYNRLVYRGLRPKIGIDIGNVIKSTGAFGVFFKPDYYGNSVNVSASLERIASGGEVLVSADFFRTIAKECESLEIFRIAFTKKNIRYQKEIAKHNKNIRNNGASFSNGSASDNNGVDSDFSEEKQGHTDSSDENEMESAAEKKALTDNQKSFKQLSQFAHTNIIFGGKNDPCVQLTREDLKKMHNSISSIYRTPNPEHDATNWEKYLGLQKEASVSSMISAASSDGPRKPKLNATLSNVDNFVPVTNTNTSKNSKKKPMERMESARSNEILSKRLNNPFNYFLFSPIKNLRIEGSKNNEVVFEIRIPFFAFRKFDKTPERQLLEKEMHKDDNNTYDNANNGGNLNKNRQPSVEELQEYEGGRFANPEVDNNDNSLSESGNPENNNSGRSWANKFRENSGDERDSPAMKKFAETNSFNLNANSKKYAVDNVSPSALSGPARLAF